MIEIGDKKIKDVYHGAAKIRTVYIGNKPLYHNFKSPMAKVFVEYNRDLGHTIPLTIPSIDDFCLEAVVPLEKDDLAYLMFGNDQFGTTNLVNPTLYKGTPFGGLNWSVDGVQGNGVNGYIDTNLEFNLNTPSTKYKIADASFGGVFTANAGDVIIGRELAGTRVYYIAGINNSIRVNSSASPLSSPNKGTNGMFCVSRNNETNFDLYRGANIENIIQGISAVSSTGNVHLLRQAAIYSSAKLSLCFFGAALTSTEFQTLRTAFNKLLISNNLTPVS